VTSKAPGLFGLEVHECKYLEPGTAYLVDARALEAPILEAFATKPEDFTRPSPSGIEYEVRVSDFYSRLATPLDDMMRYIGRITDLLFDAVNPSRWQRRVRVKRGRGGRRKRARRNARRLSSSPRAQGDEGGKREGGQ
jgi:hypothetical protein